MKRGYCPECSGRHRVLTNETVQQHTRVSGGNRRHCHGSGKKVQWVKPAEQKGA